MGMIYIHPIYILYYSMLAYAIENAYIQTNDPMATADIDVQYTF